MNETREVTARYEITGRVQGVGFRWFTRAAAREIGLSGWVRNCADGSVEAIAAGTADQQAKFEQAVRQGPSGSKVNDVEKTEAAHADLGESFEIVYQ